MPETFIHKIETIILSNIENDKFGVTELASEMNLSRSQTLRKIKSITGKSANEFIREIRLQEAAKLIQTTDLTASEIAYKIGFSSPSYFNKCFLDLFEITPGEYKKKLETADSSEILSVKKGSNQNLIRKRLVISIILIALIAMGYFIIVYPNNKSNIQQASIAVLPFLDLSENKDQEHFSDGVTDAITLELAKYKELRITSRTSSMKFKGEKRLSSEIAKDLKVNLILEGSVLHEGDSILVIVQLVKTEPKEEHLWADSYTIKYENVLQLVSNISFEIANKISSIVKPESKSKETYQIDPSAYDLFLKGRHLFNTQKTRYYSLVKAVEYLEESIRLDSNFATAYITLAECYLAVNFLILDNEEKLLNREKARQAIDKAYFLDKEMADVYITKGNLAGKFDWDWEIMKQFAEKGLELEPSNSKAHVTLSNYYVTKGNYYKAIDEALKAEELDPINPSINCLVADRYYIAHEFEKSIVKYNEVIELNPNYGLAYNGIGFAYLKSGYQDKAVESWQKLQLIMGNEALYECYNDSTFESCLYFFLENAPKKTPRFCSNPVIISSVCMIVNEFDEALEYLDIAYRYKNEDLPVMLAYPDFYALHDNPQFKELVGKVGVTLPD